MSKEPTCIRLQTASDFYLCIHVLASSMFRLTFSQTENVPQSSLVRYGIVRLPQYEAEYRVEDDKEAVTVRTARSTLRVEKLDGRIALRHARGEVVVRHSPPSAEQPRTGFEARFELDAEERLYGTGIGAETIMKRGQQVRMCMARRDAYTPVPMLMSSRGWGLFANTTMQHDFDIGFTDPDLLLVRVPSPTMEYLLFAGSSYAELLDSYTGIAGKPRLLPLWAYGLSYIGNEQANARETIEDAVKFRNAGIPCDMIGLESTWMQVHNDRSTSKNWHSERFFIPPWNPKGQHTFIGTLKAMGFKLSLWLGSDFDLTRYEERLAEERDRLAAGETGNGSPAAEQEEIWYTHLEKFVDQGVSAFKLTENGWLLELQGQPWSNGLSGEEVRNLYPLLLGKQMYNGYKKQTGQRPMLHSVEGYAGIQQYTAIWTGGLGDEPEEPKALVKMLNASLAGISNIGNDMDIHSREGIHFGFFQAWSKVNSWAYWRHPCLLDAPLRDMFKRYAKLRYRLIPYIYSAAYTAYKTGMPIMRPMPLVYPRSLEMANQTTQYMFGESFLVAAFTDQVELPVGEWIDFWTGKRYSGPARIEYSTPDDVGGPLFVRAGAIFPMWPEMDYVGQKPVDLISLHIYPHRDSEFTLFEDDGVTCSYEDGAFALTLIVCESAKHRTSIHIGARTGQYDGMPAKRGYDVYVHLNAKPSFVAVNGMEYRETTRAKKAQPPAGWSFDRLTGIVRLHVAEEKNRSGAIRIELQHGNEIARQGQTSAKRRTAHTKEDAVIPAHSQLFAQSPRHDFMTPSLTQFEKSLEIGLETGDKAKSRAALEKLLTEWVQTRAPGEAGEQLLYVSGLLARFLERKQWPMKHVFGEIYERFLNLQAETDVDAIGPILIQAAERVAEFSQKSRVSALHPLVQQLKEMVGQEMDQPFFTLAVAAERLHVNASHLSRLFKQETGKSFSEYMMELKMKHAKQLMQNGSKVADASLSVGFKDTGYFIRVFRKFWGVTPGELKM
ncbi:TIM-barrel domain-containing protein [Paenibacillus hodogayensis]|uniref:TIM-barrel domain-containing protein n=1 Tax=Paenibacillus hodogayensis TaxID=279208 RepID=A0ABV5VPS7_9BACL